MYLVAQLALLGCDFTVREPPELIAELGVLSERFARAHRASSVGHR